MSIKRSLAWMLVAQATSFLVQFATSVVVAHYLTPHEMGIFAVALAVVGMVSIFQQLGLPAFIVREEVVTPDISSTAFTINALITALLSIAILAAGFAGAVFLRDEGVQRVLLILAISPLFGIFAFLPCGHLERNGRFRELALVGTIGSIVGSLATIVFAMLHYSYMSIAYAQVVGSATYAFMMIVAGRQYFSLRLGLKAWRRVTDFSLQMLAVSGINSASLRMSDIMLGRLLGLSALGIYNRASGINGLVWGNIHLVVSRVVLVDFAELNRQGLPLRERYLQTVTLVTAILWPAFAGLAVIAKPFVLVVYGERWLPAVAPFRLLAISSMILVSITMTWELFTATGELRAQTRIEFIRAIVAFVAFIGGCLISLEAAAAARILDAVFAFLLYRPYLNRMTGTSLPDFVKIYAQSALVTVLAVAPAAGLMAFYDGAAASIPAIMAAVLLGIALWGGGLVALEHPLAIEISALLRKLPFAKIGSESR